VLFRSLEEQAATRLLGLLEQAGTAPPSIPELVAATGADPSLAHRALGTLEKQGRVKRVNKDFCFTVEALTALESKVQEHLHASSSATVAQLKDAMQTSRKYAVPLLEFFDAQGMTKREGDVRRLRTP
jgi:selenocysteine-specific elongation factor